MIESFRQMLMCACLCGLCVSLLAWLVVASVRILSRLPKAMLFTFLAMCLVATGEAQKNTNLMQFVMQLMSPRPQSPVMSFAEKKQANWNVRGAWKDSFWLDFDDGWLFPHGTNHLSGVEVVSYGELWATPADTNAVASAGAAFEIVRGLTSFACEFTPSNSYRFAWNDAALNRDTNALVSAALELFRNGDVAVTTNGVTTTKPRVLPFPHNGFGQDAEWVAANFTNAAEILVVGYANWVDAQVGVGLTNGLYKFTASFVEPPPEATLLTVGDYSVCVTNAGDYVFVLEKGTEYEFFTWPFNDDVEYSARDDMAPAAPVLRSWWGGWDAPGTWTVDGGDSWLYCPWLCYVGSCAWFPTFQGAPDVVNLTTSDFPMTFTALLTDFCRADGVTYHWSSEDERVNIVSPGSQTTQVELDASFETSEFSLSVEARTPERTYFSSLNAVVVTNDCAALTFTMPDTLFVNDDDDNDDGAEDGGQRASPDDDIAFAVVSMPEGATRRGTLCLYDKDGFYGTIYDAAIEHDYVGQGSEWELMSPFSLSLAASGTVESDSYRSSQIRFRWTPEQGTAQTAFRRFTVVEPVVEPICSARKGVMRDGVQHELVYNPSGVGIGRDAYFRISVTPGDYPDSKIHWRAVGAGAVTFIGGERGREVCVRGASAGAVTLEVDIGGCPSAKPEFPLKVVENVSVKLDVCILSNEDGPMRNEAEVRSMLSQVNDIYEQVGVSFYIDSLVVTNIPFACDAVIDGPGRERNWSFDDVAHLLPDADGLKCYFINSFVDSGGTIAANDSNGILLTRQADAVTWAHEIGHACNLDDIYSHRSGVSIPAFETFEWRHAIEDWNGGSYGERTKGSRYYRKNMLHGEAVQRLLMYGYPAEASLDISTGDVEGVIMIDRNTASIGDARTGMFSFGATRTPVHRRKGGQE